ncbi:biosynthetic arginine decarboxylase [Estrella lausannensis]|uniref:Arginine decarboxylase n=1 Tax=Estrella lausannensis TaxID=483423 RepID=A0A0H5DS96_9BACT|nr:biosynthetic arginine decarboxylase [Estrella lausannensis]CRX38609.1 Biosynthetic arginine decarboxylase [Estrella lausannensis]
MDKEKSPKHNTQVWIANWGHGYFDINEQGNVLVKPNREGRSGDLYQLVQSLVQRGVEPPILLRFDGIIRDRIKAIYAAFDKAINDYGYKNRYQAAYPIKVNPQRHVVDMVHECGRPGHIGLEVGSKPELIAVLAYDSVDNLLLCNGYKDAEYIELALLARKLGRRSIIIIEQLYELKMVLDAAIRLNVEAEIGFRMKPYNKGSGRWGSSGGDLAKFGLSIHEIVAGLDQLKAYGKTHWLKLLHYHMGSQVPTIATIKKVLNEAARMFIELAKECPSLCFFDVGGGLGVDYDGSKSANDSSMNYTIDEYAKDVVAAIGDACDKADMPHPVILSESGRAIAAHHSVLITEVIDVSPTMDPLENIEKPPTDHEILETLCYLYNEVTTLNCEEFLHDAIELKEKILNSFIYEGMSLIERAYAEKVYKQLISKIAHLAKNLDYVPEEIDAIDRTLLDVYFCNFSVFQSLPDAWAIGQIFPVMPIHRMKDEPKRRAIIADLSCDSDGKIDCFSSRIGPKYFLRLHEPNQQPYYLGVFLVGAYQEILGGMHNLFGDTNTVHVDVDEDGMWEVTHVVEGDTISEVLDYVEYDADALNERLRSTIEKSLRAGRLTNEESAKLQKKFKQALESYTYLVV